MEITNETKLKMFEEMLRLEHLGEVETYDGRNYAEMSNGAYAMLSILGLGSEYIAWSYGK